MKTIAVSVAILVAGVAGPTLIHAQPVGEGSTETDVGQEKKKTRVRLELVHLRAPYSLFPAPPV